MRQRRSRKMQREIVPCEFRQEGLDLITFNFPPAITFPTDHFSPQLNVCNCMDREERGNEEWKEKVYVFKAIVLVVDAAALESLGYLICNMSSTAGLFRG